MSLCQCGCGNIAPICKCTNNKKGIRKGQFLKFIHGHHRRKQEHEMYEIDTSTGCWNWILGTANGENGNHRYGLISNVLAHRMMYEKYKGKIQDGLILDHLCRNTLCVNPDHLEAVTEAINTQRGIGAKLNREKVLKIRKYFRTWDDLAVMAEEHEVAWNTVYDALTGRTWRNVPNAVTL